MTRHGGPSPLATDEMYTDLRQFAVALELSLVDVAAVDCERAECTGVVAGGVHLLHVVTAQEAWGWVCSADGIIDRVGESPGSAYASWVTGPLVLPEPGQPPRWGEGGSPTPMDGEIEAAPTWSIEKQEQLFFRFARHLFDNQVRDRVDERADSSNNDAWLAALAEWLGWDSERREAVINRAAEAAMVVLPDETFDPTERG